MEKKTSDSSEDSGFSEAGGSRNRSIDEGSIEFHVDPETKKLRKGSVKEKAPEFITKPRRQFVNEGETAKFKTTFEGSSRTKLIWSKNGKVLASDDRFKIYQEKENHLLEIQKVTADDQGTYTCTIQNSAGSASASAELEIFVRPAPHGKKSVFLPPTVDVPLEDTEFANGEKDACLSCKFSNAIDGTATWFKDGREVGSWQAKSTFDGRTAKLTLREASKRNCGVYECLVKNSGGEAKTRALVSLLDPKVKPAAPKFLVSLNDQTVDSGDKLVLETEVTGKPRPSLKWYKDNSELGSSQDIRMEYKDGKGRLIVENMSADESATFTCVAQNVAGQEQTKAAVQIRGGSEDLREPPIFTKELSDVEVDDGDRVELGVEVKGTLPIDIVWVHNNREIPPTDPVCRMVANGNSRKLIIPEVFPEDAGEYVCEAYNDYGDTDTFCRLVVREKEQSIENLSFSPEFVIRPQSTSVTKGNSAIFTCQVSGQPPPTISWYKGKESIKQGRKYKIVSAGDQNTLEIVSATITDADEYTCTLTNSIGDNQCVVTLQVGETTPANYSPTDIRTVLKTKSNSSQTGKASSTCSETSDISLDQNPTQNILMDRNSRRSESPVIEKKGGITQVDFRGVLKKPGTTKQNDKETVQSDRNGEKIDFRSVLSRSQRGAESKQTSKSLFIKNGPSFIREQKSTPVLAVSKKETSASGKQIDFRSVLKKHSDPNPKVPSESEFKGASKDRSSSSYIKVEDEKPRKPPQSSLVSKLADTEVSSAIRQPVERKRRPRFQSHLENRSVTRGGQVVLECEVVGHPEPEIIWSFKDKEIKKSKFFQMSYENNIARLVIEEAFSEDEGEYSCTATNTAGSTTRSCNLHVEDAPQTTEPTDDDDEEEDIDEEEKELYSPEISPPKIYDISPSRFSILRGGMMEFRASFSAVPKAEVKWCKNKTPIISDGRLKVDTTEHFSTLTIISVQPGDSGRYNVTVENDISSDMASASLTVEDVPDPPVGQPFVFDVTKTSVTLSWSGPAYDGGCPITNYRVEFCDAEDRIWTPVTSSCQNTTYHIDQLTPSTPYFFRVFAENRHGISQPCQTSEVTVTTDKRPNMLRTLSVESDGKRALVHAPKPVNDVFVADVTEATTPLSSYDLVSPLSPDELPFEHREVTMTPGRLFDEHYECLEEVGKGKFGSVFRCKEKSSDKTWAAKIIKCREADKPKLRLEVEIMNRLKHPKILMLWDVFEVPRKMILVMEFIGGGELFERVLDDDFELTEHDCIQFMRQICDAVSYMHSQNILHLDLKPENILCIKNESNKIKIIDFGLARFYKPGESTRVLFGTPEFIAPEVVNYEEIGFQTDMWSLGVICYVLLSGLSPFMGDSDAETLSNVTQGDFDFEDESFENISDNAKDFIDRLLMKDKRKRLTAEECIRHQWLAQDTARTNSRKINTKNLKRFMARRKWQKTGNAIRALGRMTSLQKLFKKEASDSTSSSGSSSVSSLTPVTQVTSVTSDLSSVNSDLSSVTVVSDSVSKVKLLEDPDRIRTRNGGISEEYHKESDQTSRNGSHFSSKTDINSNNRTKCVNQNLPSDSLLSNRVGEKIKSTNQNSLESTTSNSGSPADDTSISENVQEQNQTEENETSPGSPKFTKEMIDSKAFPGDSVRFDVIASGEPQPEIEWYFEDDLITAENSRHTIQYGDDGQCSLIIKDVTDDDDGEYSCSAINESGEAVCSAELIVYGAI